jgi:hypothetical protein
MTVVAIGDPVASIRLLIRLLRGDPSGTLRCVELRPDAYDALAAFTVDTGLSIVLLRALEARGMAHEISADRRRALAQRRDLQLARHANLAAGLVRLADVLQAADIPFMLLKGPYLGARIYGDPRGREFLDLDLLVRQTDRRRACDVVAQAGYRRRSRVLGSATLTARFVHGFDYVGDGVNLDLHWGFSRHPSLRLDESLIWQHKSSFTIDGRSYAVPGDEHEVTLQVLALLRDIERGRAKPKNIVDLVQVVAAVDSALSWDALFARGRDEGTRGPLVNVLALCLDVADAHDYAPRLAGTLARHAGRRVAMAKADVPPRFAALQPGLGSRLWAARSYDASLVACLAWWFVSMPFRRAAHGWPRPTAPRPGGSR